MGMTVHCCCHCHCNGKSQCNNCQKPVLSLLTVYRLERVTVQITVLLQVSDAHYGGPASSDNEGDSRNAVTIVSSSVSYSVTTHPDDELSRNSAIDSNDFRDIWNKYNQPISMQSRLLCTGVGEHFYHAGCIDAVTSPGIWYCLQCSIFKVKSVHVLRHIPKGVRIQTAQLLAQAIEDCVPQPLSTAPWRHIFLCPVVALQAVTISKKMRKESL